MPPSTPGKTTLKPRQWASSGSVYPIVPPRALHANVSRRNGGSETDKNGARDAKDVISVAKRRHGLNRCRYKGDQGMKRWVGLGIIADTLFNIGRAMAQAAVEP